MELDRAIQYERQRQQGRDIAKEIVLEPVERSIEFSETVYRLSLVRYFLPLVYDAHGHQDRRSGRKKVYR